MAAISTALSGLDASATRLDASANNVANAQSTGALSDGAPAYTPVSVAQSALPSGGVAARAEDIVPPATPHYQPDAVYATAQGLVGAPDIDLAREAVNQIAALRSYRANAAVIRTWSQTQKTLLNIV